MIDSEMVELVRRVARLERMLEQAVASRTTRLTYVISATGSDPPTDAELDSAFGTPLAVQDGFVGVLSDTAGSPIQAWLCITSNSSWWYEELTKAL